VTPTTPVVESPEQIAAARIAREENAMFLTVIQEGRYTDLYLKRLAASAPPLYTRRVGHHRRLDELHRHQHLLANLRSSRQLRGWLRRRAAARVLPSRVQSVADHRAVGPRGGVPRRLPTTHSIVVILFASDPEIG
jgi:hypothetical protein